MSDLHLRARMVRAGLGPGQLIPYYDPERGRVDPFDDQETRAAIRGLLADLWNGGL